MTWQSLSSELYGIFGSTIGQTRTTNMGNVQTYARELRKREG